MEIDESAIDSLIKALATNKSSEIVDVARKRDAQVRSSKTKTLNVPSNTLMVLKITL